MEIKLVISNPKTGKTYQKAVDGAFLQNKQMGEKVSGDSIGLSGFELEITGGSDTAGFPMRWDLKTAGRKKALLTKGPCVHLNREGMKKRKTVRGNTVSDVTMQVNTKITKAGAGDVEELLGVKKEAPAEDKKEETQ